MIEAAVILSAVARHWPDFALILLLLLANAMVGFWEEHQAGNAIAALKAKLWPLAPSLSRNHVQKIVDRYSTALMVFTPKERKKRHQ